MDAVERAMEERQRREKEEKDYRYGGDPDAIMAALKAELKPDADAAPGRIKEAEAYIPSALAELDRLEKTHLSKNPHYAMQIDQLRFAALNGVSAIREALNRYNELSVKELTPGLRYIDRAAALRSEINPGLITGRGLVASLKKGIEELQGRIDAKEKREADNRALGMPGY